MIWIIILTLSTPLHFTTTTTTTLEILLLQGYDYSIDIWASGILLHEMKFGRTPFSDRDDIGGSGGGSSSSSSSSSSGKNNEARIIQNILSVVDNKSIDIYIDHLEEGT